MVAKEPGVRSERSPAVSRCASPLVVRSSDGSTPRTRAPIMCRPYANSAWLSTYGAAATTPLAPRTRCCRACQSLSLPSRPAMVACEVTASMRVRSSRSKPFITESTTISVATPSIRPHTDMSATKETKPRRCVERR